MRIVRAKDYDDMSRKAGNIMAAQVVAKPDCVLGLATGSTPIGAYKRLIEGYEAGDIDFSQVKTYNLDEYRGLPGDHDQSYRYFMNVNLFDHVNIDKANTHVPDGLADDYEAACPATRTSSSWASATTATSASTSPATPSSRAPTAST